MITADDVRRAISGPSLDDRILAPLRLCEFSLDHLAMQGVGVALISSPAARSLLSASGTLAGIVEDLQFSLGEGPCLDAFNTVEPSSEPDLAGAGLSRWPVFAPAATRAGVRAVFAFPLRIDGACFGVLDLARDRPGALDDGQIDDAKVLADVATETVLALQADADGDDVADQLGGIGSERIVVHQASGMVAAQTGIDVAAALARLRAHAYVEGRPLTDIARDVVARTMTFQA